ncbi:hypothetical protein B1400_0218 [Bifidobacterium italicum]|uniref:Uncharacterized protein n=1 Tax=Bifidobacterium italicum TaxID=1960968 RepID=A0A2A2ELD7_9BIFI|nr:hypothetical protein B1400_0218 [Bifidobacterium italicum]
MKRFWSVLGVFLTLLLLCALLIGKTTHTYRYMWLAPIVAAVFSAAYALSLHDDGPQDPNRPH